MESYRDKIRTSSSISKIDKKNELGMEQLEQQPSTTTEKDGEL